MGLNQSNNIIEVAPTVPVVETVINVPPPPFEAQPTKPVDQTTPAQPPVPFDASTTMEVTPSSVQISQPVETQNGATPLFRFDGYVEGVSVPSDMDLIARFAAAYGQQSMQNPEDSPPPSQGAK